MKQFKLTISLVVLNGARYLPFCLDSILKQNFSDFELFIIDNGSSDQSVEIIKKYRLKLSFRTPTAVGVRKLLSSDRQKNDNSYHLPSLRDSSLRSAPFGMTMRECFVFQKNSENLGFAFAHNQVINRSRSEYILVLNQDVILAPNYLSLIIDFLEKNPTIGAVSGKILKWDGLTAPNENAKIDSTGLKIFKSQRVVEKIDDLTEPTAVFGVSATAAVYRRKALDVIARSPKGDEAIPRPLSLRARPQAGEAIPLFSEGIASSFPSVAPRNDNYFDPDFFAYKEDIDLAYRLNWAGWQSYCLPQALAWHQRAAQAGATAKETIKHRQNKPAFINYHSYKNHFFVLIKNLSFSDFFWYFPYIFAYELKKLLYLIFFEQSTLKSLIEVIKKLPRVWQKRKEIMRTRRVGEKEVRKWFA